MLDQLSKNLKQVTRSITAENKRGAKAGGSHSKTGVNAYNARELEKLWKIDPYIMIQGGQTYTLAEIQGSGKIQHIWMTCDPKYWRHIILNFYWEGKSTPAISVPLGDFFCNAWCEPTCINSIPIAVNPSGGFNSYWEMPFLTQAKIEIEVLDSVEIPFFYQIDFCYCEHEEEPYYFCAYWNRSNPSIPMEEHIILPKIVGQGNYVGTYMGWQPNSSGVWVEGEVKMFLDGDEEHPTINGTGTEDYFGGSWAWCQDHQKGQYEEYSTAFSGMQKMKPSENQMHQQQRFGMYRWHVLDPVCFNEDLKVTIQPLGWRSNERYLPLRDDISSLALWYQKDPENQIIMDYQFTDLEII